MLHAATRHFSRALWIAAFAVSGCDGEREVDPRDGAPPADAAPDAADDAGDAGPPPTTCDETLATFGRLALLRCADGARFTVTVGGAPLLERAGPVVDLEGERVEVARWPLSTWRQAGRGRLIARFAGLADRPALELSIALATDGLTVRIELDGADLAAPLSVGAIEPLVATLASEAPGRAGVAADFEVLPGAERHLLIAAGDLRDGRVAIATDATSLTARSMEPAGTLGPGQRLASPSVTLRFGPDPAALLAAQVAVWATQRPPRARRVMWGWRSSAAYGALVNARVLEAQADAIAAWAPAPWIVADGLWFTALGDWRPAPDALPAGAQLGLSWPAFAVSADAPPWAEHPEWLRVDARGRPSACVEGWPTERCTWMEPALPAVRDHLTRAALALSVSALSVPDGPAEPGTFALRALGASLRRALGNEAWLGTNAASAWAWAGDADFVRVGPWAASSTGAGCLPGEAPPEALDVCHAAARALTVEAADTPPDPLPERARALAAAWPLVAAVGGADLGPVVVGAPRPAGEARQAAALAALSGGPYLLGDSAIGLEDARLELFRAALPLVGGPPAQPVDSGEPPAIWHAPGRALALFNWTDAAFAFASPAAHAPELRRVVRLRFDPADPAAEPVDLGGLASVDVPPHDVVILMPERR